MSYFFAAGGPIMWLLLLLALVIIFLFVRKIIDIYFRKNLSSQQMENGIHSIIFWGAISLVLGFFAHFQGVYIAMNEIARAQDISPAVVAQGYGMSLTTILFGMFIFIVSAIAWFFLRWRYKKIVLNLAGN